MRLRTLTAALALLSSNAIAGPVLVQDDRVLSAFAHSIDAGGDGLGDGPHTTSLGVLGGYYSDTIRAESSGGNFNAVSISGAEQLSFFEAGPAYTFNSSGSAQVLAKARLGASRTEASSTNSARLVFELDATTAFGLEGILGVFAIGGAESSVSVSLYELGETEALFERTLSGAFTASGELGAGTWVLEMEAYASLLGEGAGLSDANAGAVFREIRLTLVPAPGALCLACPVGAMLVRRRRA